MSWEKICSRCDGRTHYDMVWNGGVHTCRCGRKYRCVFRPMIGHDWVEMLSWKRLKDWVAGK